MDKKFQIIKDNFFEIEKYIIEKGLLLVEDDNLDNNGLVGEEF